MHCDTRRTNRTGFGAATIGALAGCTSSDVNSSGSSGSRPEAQSSFFVFEDFTSQVAGEIATTERLVPIGQHGHGWEPGPQIQGVETDATEVLPLPIPEQVQEWADTDWGCVETMENVNPKTLKKALGAA